MFIPSVCGASRMGGLEGSVQFPPPAGEGWGEDEELMCKVLALSHPSTAPVR